MLEKNGVVGGTSNLTIEGYGSVGDKTHSALGSPLDAKTQADNLAATYGESGSAEALTVFAEDCGPQADWLRSIGAVMGTAASQASVAPAREYGRLGVCVMAALESEARKVGVQILTNTPAVSVEADGEGGYSVGVSSVEGDQLIACKAVVIAAGGYAASKDMLAKYHPGYEALDSSCGCGSTGDGIVMAESLGAGLADTDYVRVNFTYSNAPNGYFYYVGSLFNEGAIFVDSSGKRIVNDQSAYGIGPKLMELTGGSGWAVFDDSICQSGGDVRWLKSLGLFTEADSIEELAEKCGIDAAGLAATVEKYRGYVVDGEDPEFGRAMLNMSFDEPPFHACPTMCRAQGTFGGIACSVAAEVLDEEGAVIPGLYAAGENAAIGTYGANPASVNVVFGSIAGTNAAAYAGFEG